MSTHAAITTAGLAKTYRVGFWGRRVLALQETTLSIAAGQIYGLLGPNGAGKSTFIKLLLNLIQPTAGSALVFGRPPTDAEGRAQVGYLPENPTPYEYLTGAEFVRLAGVLAGLRGTELEQRVTEVIGLVGMSGAAGLQIRRYSKGMTQRVSLAQALVAKPKLLILDEPTSGLDVLGRQLIREIILEQRRQGTTVLLCSHIIPDVEALCDRVAVVIGGKILKEGSVAELLEQDASGVELTVSHVDEATVNAMTSATVTASRLGERWLLRLDEGQSPAVLRRVLDAGGRVVHLQRTRYSLEDLFVRAVKESGRSVGSTVE